MLRKGKIIEAGDHDALMARGGIRRNCTTPASGIRRSTTLNRRTLAKALKPSQRLGRADDAVAEATQQVYDRQWRARPRSAARPTQYGRETARAVQISALSPRGERTAGKGDDYSVIY